MRGKLSHQVIEAYVHCATKFHLSLHGFRGKKSDYDLMCRELHEKVRAYANNTLPDVNAKSQARPNSTTSSAVPQKISQAMFEDDRFCLKIEYVHLLQRNGKTDGLSILPNLFLDQFVKVNQYIFPLTLHGFLLGELLNTRIDKGLLWIGERPARTVALDFGNKGFLTWRDSLIRASSLQFEPPLRLSEHCAICEFQSRCHDRAMKDGNLSLLRGMTENEISKYKAKGLFNIDQISYTFRARRPPKRSKKASSPHYFSLQAQAIREKKIFIHGSPWFDIPSPRIYFDIEGGLNKGSYYLIGALLEVDKQTRYYPFWSDDEHSRICAFSEFLEFISKHHDLALLHYGSYETDALRSVNNLLPEKYALILKSAIERSVNILSLIRSRIYFPTFSNGLKDVGGSLGATWSEANSSGLQSLVWRYRWLVTREHVWKERLLQYNREDCDALRRVVHFLDSLNTRTAGAGGPEAPSLAFTDSLPKSETRRPIFRRAEFALTDFHHINQCAYFDYQRDRAATRPPGRRKPRNTLLRPPGAANSKLSKTVEIISKRCPGCRSKHVTAGPSLNRTVIDLKFSFSGVKRWVVRYASAKYKCEKCGQQYFPDGFPIGDTKFGWGLKVWCIYNHFVSGQNLSRITTGLAQLFQVRVPQPSVHRFKSSVADDCKSFCREIFSDLMRSASLYIDETPVNLRLQKGYVWVISDGGRAYYFYRSSREGSFLGELLKSYSGVLVSDFFTAYDSLNIPKQKCLIHLLRDINDEMLRHPYDEGLKSIGRRFSEVLSAIVATIDAHGLKKRYLNKHKNAAARFINWMESTEFISRPAIKIRNRIVKYKNMLFTFIEHDNVAWHNNNAEHAMKTFARYRRFSDGRFTARSI